MGLNATLSYSLPNREPLHYGLEIMRNFELVLTESINYIEF